jgi:hypothetical protein
MNEMVFTMSRSASSSSSFSCASFYFFPSGLTHRREKITCPTPLKGLHPILSSAVMDVVSILSKWLTPLGSSLCSWTFQWLVSSPWFSLQGR